MVPILLNAKLVTTSDGFVRKLSLEFTQGNKRKHEGITLLPGMTREEVATSLRSGADQVEKTCATESIV